jgi:flagellar export protein FliJ
MSRQRLKRIARLVALRESARDAAQAKLAEARRMTEAARNELAEAETAWRVEADAVAAETALPASEFALRRAHLQWLRRAIDRAAERLRLSEEHEHKELEATTQAQRELRKMEVWSETETARHQLEENRKDQILTDELAARIVQ